METLSARSGRLLFDNGYGGFTRDGGDYRITLPAGRQTPAPWCNPLCSDCFGTLAGESGWFSPMRATAIRAV